MLEIIKEYLINQLQIVYVYYVNRDEPYTSIDLKQDTIELIIECIKYKYQICTYSSELTLTFYKYQENAITPYYKQIGHKRFNISDPEALTKLLQQIKELET